MSEAAAEKEKKQNPLAKYREEQKKKAEEKQSGEKYEVDPEKTYTFVLIENPKGSHILTPEFTIYDETEKRVKTIRYVKGLKTLNKEDQGDVPASMIEPIVFHKGKCRVNGLDEFKVKCLLMSDLFDGKENRLTGAPPLYTLEDKELLAEIKNRQLVFKTEALNMVKEKDIEELKPLAKIALQIPDTAKPVDIRNGLLELADKDPKFVVSQLSNPKTIRKYNIQKAVERAVIENLEGTVVWRASNNPITTISKYKDTLDELVEYSFTKEGEGFYKTLLTQLN